MQTNPELGSSVASATRTLIKTEGFPFLLKGLAPTCAGYGVEGALKFGCYELMKPICSKLTPSKTVNYLLASVVAGAVASTVLCPAEEIRIKQVSDPAYADAGTIDTFRQLAAENGALASLDGMPAMCAKQVPYTMGKQVSFDLACECVRTLFHMACVEDCAWRSALDKLVPCVAALPAAVLACVMSHPGDMILTMYYKNTQGGGKSMSVLETARALIEQGGLAELFRGLRARLVHVMAIIWVQLVVYDQAKRFLGLPATGGH